LKYDILIKNISYNPASGELTNKRTSRRMNVDADGFVYYTESSPERIHIKIKANKLCCLLGFGKPVTASQRVIHRNLDYTDFKITNLLVVTRKELLKINEARSNLEGKLKLVPHPSDQLSYFLHWKENGVDKRQLILDIVVARRKLVKLQLKYSKILSKYCIFD
jgi:hypothetical protein